MAEMEGTSAIIPAASALGPRAQGDLGVYSINIADYSPSGKKEEFAVALPNDAKWGNVMLRAAILKRTTWKQFEIPVILHAIIYADSMGLDIMAGDVYQAEEGRLSTTAGAKIRHAMSGDRIEGYSVEITEGPEITLEYTQRNETKVWKGKDLKAKVTVDVRGWKAPVVYNTTLGEWFVGRNPNWRTRPAYMLRRNALSKALEEVAPMGVDVDEAPPVAPAYGMSGFAGEQASVGIPMAQAKRVP